MWWNVLELNTIWCDYYVKFYQYQWIPRFRVYNLTIDVRSHSVYGHKLGNSFWEDLISTIQVSVSKTASKKSKKAPLQLNPGYATVHMCTVDCQRMCLRISLLQLSLYWLAFTGTLNLPTQSHSSFIPYVGVIIIIIMCCRVKAMIIRLISRQISLKIRNGNNLVIGWLSSWLFFFYFTSFHPFRRLSPKSPRRFMIIV